MQVIVHVLYVTASMHVTAIVHTPPRRWQPLDAGAAACLRRGDCGAALYLGLDSNLSAVRGYSLALGARLWGSVDRAGPSCASASTALLWDGKYNCIFAPEYPITRVLFSLK